MRRDQIEIMAPVGSFESLHAAVQAGADAVYFGVGKLNMRSASAANFTEDDLGEIVDTAHAGGLKAYLTVNTVMYDDEMEQMRRLIDLACLKGVDALIVSDMAAILYAASRGIEIHISTQLNVSNTEALRFFSQWADVVVLARELSLEQIAVIHRAIVSQNICGPSGRRVRIEMFAHGALCMAVSGKCYLSLHESGCSANRGACRQICRRAYILSDASTGEELRAEGRYLLSPKDLCTVGFLDRFLDAGVSVLKIEGRARPAEYVKRVVAAYDEALRAIEDGSYGDALAQSLTDRLSTVFNRGFWGGYYLGRPMAEHSRNYGSAAVRKKVFVGLVTNVFRKIGVIEVKVTASPLESGRDIIVTGHTTGVAEFRAETVMVDGKPVQSAPQGVACSLKAPEGIHRGDRLFKEVDADEVMDQERG